MAHDYEEDVRSLVWFLAGLGVGVAVALLFAPQSGRDTRRMLARTAERSKDYLSESAEDLKERGRELYDRGREVAEDAADLLERGRKKVRG